MQLFAHRLALELGIWDVDGMLEAMPARQLNRWLAYYSLEPFGAVRGDIQAGVIASTVANVHRGKTQTAFTPNDFLPNFKPKPKQTGAQIAAALNSISKKAV